MRELLTSEKNIVLRKHQPQMIRFKSWGFFLVCRCSHVPPGSLSHYFHQACLFFFCFPLRRKNHSSKQNSNRLYKTLSQVLLTPFRMPKGFLLLSTRARLTSRPPVRLGNFVRFPAQDSQSPCPNLTREAIWPKKVVPALQVPLIKIWDFITFTVTYHLRDAPIMFSHSFELKVFVLIKCGL